MITRDQYKYLSIFQQRQHGDNFFSMLPPEMINDIYKVKPSKNSDISKALDLAADAEQAAVAKLLAMLDEDPSLLLQAGNVVTRGGNTIIGVTPYEFALGAGDPELAAKIAPYFDKISGGEAERERQYNRYKPHIDAMQTQAPYDLNSLIDIITKSPAADVTACLNKNFENESELNNALKKFREDHAPRIIRKPCMHYNHRTLQQTFGILRDKWDALSNNYEDFDKCKLVYRQIIGYLQRTLPGIDRIGFARAFKDKERVLNFIFDGVNRFPDTYGGEVDSVIAGLGIDKLIFGKLDAAEDVAGGHAIELGNYQSSCRTKTSNLQSLCSHKELRRLGV